MSLLQAPAAGGLAPGFADPALAAQAVFRAVLGAMASPGTIAALPGGSAVAPEAPLPQAAACVALTLADFETPVWLSPALADAADWLRFHSGAPIAASPGATRFAFARAADCPPLEAFDLGSDAYPDRSTTAVIEVAALGAGTPVTLTGPGLRAPTVLRVTGLDDAFWAARERLVPLFPRGLDVILTAGAALAALPRTTRARIAPLQAQGA
jgi:alpha-D-ribose 1-methylphosphonate 5-triphosphate synthase subunit PhnH